MSYLGFLNRKTHVAPVSGIEMPGRLNGALFDFQREIVRWALRRGRAAIFADCGMGKTLMQLEWARVVARKTSGRVLVLAPLAVASQTVREGHKFGISATYSRDGDVADDIVITNYEMLHHFSPDDFAGIVLDESSILKSYTGKFRNQIIDSFKDTPYRLACTATPAPNDHMELGNHAEFLGVMTRTEMLATYFVHDGGETQKWRLKGHASDDFWRWVCSWGCMARKPSDLGFVDDDGEFVLPEMRIHNHVVDVSVDQAPEGMLFALEAQTLQERLVARRSSVGYRAQLCADIVAKRPDESWVIWCNLNSESAAVTSLIPGAVEVKGSDSREHKESALLRFSSGDIRVLVSKPSIAGHGMNWQHCHNMAYVGLSDSYEQFYQSSRRCWRFGQKSPVDVHVITASTEGAVLKNIQRKNNDASTMGDEMARFSREALSEKLMTRSEYIEDRQEGDSWTMVLGDSVETIASIPSETVGYTVFSPPFASLYTYSDSPRDMGNCKTHGEFYEHFAYLVGELMRVTMPGRLLSFHCMNLPTSKVRDGVIGLTDFRGMLIKLFADAGWIYHSEVVIWKDPVTAMQRTKALGLLYKQLRKDSAMSRQGLPDYLVTMRKPGDNQEPLKHTHEDFPVEFWQRYASPVWMDINPSRTLQHRSARDERDERHICPLQLDVIERALDLWSQEGDLVLSPFAGIGSEGWCAVRKGRRFVGLELKKSYFDLAVANLQEASGESVRQLQMFG